MRLMTQELISISKDQQNERFDKRIISIENLKERLRQQLRAAEEQIITNSEVNSVLLQKLQIFDQ